MGLYNFLTNRKFFKSGKLDNKKSIVPVEKKIILTSEEISEYTLQVIFDRTSIEPEEEYSSITFERIERDELFEDAARLIVNQQSGSISLIQRKLKLGYNRAGRLMDQLEGAGIVGPRSGPYNSSSDRKVLISKNQLFFWQGKIVNERQNHFYVNVLPQEEEHIASMVKIIVEERENSKEEELRKTLKQEILDKEHEKTQNEKRKQLEIQIRKELIEEGVLSDLNELNLKRESIPQDVIDKVWNRDGGKCVLCSSQDKIEFDHIIPFSKGGSNTYRNLQILCEKCNRKKSNKIG